MGHQGHPVIWHPADRVTGVTYDSGALIAAERGERLIWGRHRALLLRRVVPTVPAPVVAQCWRGTPRQAQLARLLAGCEVETLDDTGARATGTLAGRARTTDIVDANVVEGALRRGDVIISSDEGDLAAIAAAIRKTCGTNRQCQGTLCSQLRRERGWHRYVRPGTGGSLAWSWFMLGRRMVLPERSGSQPVIRLAVSWSHGGSAW
ncbi:MAG: hypothetical protein JOY82_03590 [Streptosporangiaceae bacterium]|nr:hypothetical protein [Streptosporangiaceae bacterium]